MGVSQTARDRNGGGLDTFRIEPLLGVTALESVGIVVDPANKTLKRLLAVPLK
ncbi:MAG: hypothetical protein HZB55_04300 [Deltaproteobacteria bacterium]|nr:hypothetical protein [Deltaproteobacteria bacterium]